MNLKEFANVDVYYKDLDTGQDVPWEDYMHRVIEKLGLHNIKPYIPYDLKYLKEKLKTDVHFNNTSLSAWDGATGFIPYKTKTGVQQYAPSHYSGVSSLFVRNGITSFSVSDGVCVLKEAARVLIKEMENESSRET